MISLLDVELRRAVSRRLVRIIVLLGIVGVLIGGVVTIARSSRTPRAAAVIVGGPAPAECVNVPGDIDGTAPGTPERQDFCERSIREGQESLRAAGDRRFYLTALKNVLGGMTAPLALVAVLLSASLIGAEWRAGSVATTLTWEPRRGRLLAMKLLAALIVCTALYFLIYGLLSLMLWIAATTRGTTQGADLEFARATVTQSLRGLAVVLFGAVLGFSFGSVGRNTAAALGVGFGYMLIGENLLFNLVHWLRPWLLIANSVILVRGHGIEEILGYTATKAAIKIGCYAAGLVIITFAVFHERDVTA
ncbi:MAG: hypothetical protein ABR552_05325 [Actinomycetota bacterium]